MPSLAQEPLRMLRPTEGMRALQLRADWSPRPGDAPGADPGLRSTDNASKAWRDPHAEAIHLPIPEIGPHQVLIRVRACGVCGSDLHCLETDEDGYVLFTGPARLPVTLGHEFSGEVVATGSEVSTLRPGDPVAVESVTWCGLCTACRSGRPNQCDHADLLGFTVPGAYAEYVAVHERHCWRLDSLLESTEGEAVFEVGALVEPIGCAFNAMFGQGAAMRPGAYVAVLGAGPIGLAAVMLARASGAAKVFAFDPIEPRSRLALELGADFAASPYQVSAPGALHELTGGEGIDLVIEAAGAASETIPAMIECLAPNGRVLFLGRRDTIAEVDFNPLVTRANHLIGARGHSGCGTYPNVIRLLASGRIPARRMITSRFEFGDIFSALEQAGRRVDGKVMVTFGDP